MAVSPNSLENLKKGPRWSKGDEAASKAGKKGRAIAKRNFDIKKLARTMLNAENTVDESLLKMVRDSGFDCETPETIMLFLVRLKVLALSKNVDPKYSMDAIRLILEMSGDDVKSRENADRKQLEKERLQLERQRLAMMQESKTENELEDVVKIIKTDDGGLYLEGDD